jgi:hypothetical protein
MSTEIAGIIFRSNNKTLLSRFYTDLGLKSKEHQHGGPKHYEILPMSDDAVLEVYLMSESFPQDALMVYVNLLSESLSIIAKGYGIYPAHTIKETHDSLFTYIKDPDGRLVMLIQKK